MTPVERVLVAFLLDTAEAFSRYEDSRKVRTDLEADIHAAMRRCFVKLPTVAVMEATAPQSSQPTLGADA